MAGGPCPVVIASTVFLLGLLTAPSAKGERGECGRWNDLRGTRQNTTKKIERRF